jgi:L-asparaginase
MATVQIVTTGGTIASRLDPETGAVVPAVRAEELLAQVPALRDAADVRFEEFGLTSSWNVTPMDVARWAKRIREILADGSVAGVVVTHGTDTLEETAFALDLLWDGPAPIVLTGAMRNSSETGPDGPRNLLGAVRVAADPLARGLGVLAVLHDEVHAARVVTKSHTTALDAFSSPRLGPVATIDASVWWRWRPSRVTHLPQCEPAPGVHLVKMAAGMEPLLLRAALETGARGVVIEGSGAGNVHGSWEEPLRALIERGVPVVLTSRTGAGRVVPAYGGPGGGRQLVALGVIPAGDLSGPKARVALMFALGAGLDGAGIRELFARLGGGR